TTVVTHGYAPRGIVLPKASHVPVFTGPLNDASAVLHHADRLHNLLRTYSLLTPLDDPQREENRRVSILEVANNSVECAGLLTWVDNVGWMMETNGESNWDVWVVAFKDAVLPLEWAVSEQRSLHHLQFATARNWAAFNTQATQHHHNLMGTDRYPSDAQMALVYCTACPDSLYPCVKMKWAYNSGSLHEI
ncbi:ubiquitin carboxyl-terminal hydrolase 48, partial [Cryptococcus neoformans Bt63]